MKKAKYKVTIEIADNGWVLSHTDNGYGTDLLKSVHHPIEDTLYDLLERLIDEDKLQETCMSLVSFFLDKSRELNKPPVIEAEKKKDEDLISDDVN